MYNVNKLFFRTGAALSLMLLPGCMMSPHDAIQSLDYSRIKAAAHENDTNYTPPSVVGCVDDDLYNCNDKNAY
jgi:hypothetical protein